MIITSPANPFLLFLPVPFPLPSTFHLNCRAAYWTFDEDNFSVASESSISNGSNGENCLKKFTCEVGVQCHQSCLAALVYCTKLHRKLIFSLCSFCQISFLLTFETAKALVLKFGSPSLNHLFSMTLLAIFAIFSFKSNLPVWTKKMGQILHTGNFLK